jgi:hypothetical protein
MSAKSGQMGFSLKNNAERNYISEVYLFKNEKNLYLNFSPSFCN